MVIKENEFAQLLAKKCHAIICANQFMADLLKEYNNNSYAIRTFADLQLIESIPESKYDVFTIVFASTCGLGMDLVCDIVQRLDNDSRYKIICIINDRHDRLINFKNVITYNRLPFHKMIRIIKGSHVLLNPVLSDEEVRTVINTVFKIDPNIFLNCKAEIKYALAGATKTCLLSSQTYAYKNAIKNYENGILLLDNADKWVSAIKELSNNENLRQRIVNNAYGDVIKNYSFESAARTMINTLEKIHEQSNNNRSKDMGINIQEDYWTGTECLENEVPWFVPDSIYYLSNMCDSDDVVLDLGSGGSTFFFAKRCKQVISIETNFQWFQKMKKKLCDNNVSNVVVLYLQNQAEIESLLKSFSEKYFNIALVDTVHGFDRSMFIDIIANKINKMFVLNNYSSHRLLPSHFDKTKDQIVDKCFGQNSEHWFVKDFNDIKWTGSGTRVMCKKIF